MNPPSGARSFSPGVYGSPTHPVAGETWPSADCRVWIYNGDAGLWKWKRSGLWQSGPQELQPGCTPQLGAGPVTGSPAPGFTADEPYSGPPFPFAGLFSFPPAAGQQWQTAGLVLVAIAVLVLLLFKR